jgi:hypothetical protein
MQPNLSATDFAMNNYNWLRERGVEHIEAKLIAAELMIEFNNIMLHGAYAGVLDTLNKRVSN